MIISRVILHARHLWLMAFSARFRRIRSAPIFVVGCSHSGTTLLLRIIGAHPEVYPILNETKVFANRQFSSLKSFDLDAYRNGRNHWAEKTPDHINHLDEIFEHRPGARVVLILRDGRDVAVSIKKRNNAFEAAVNQWVDTNSRSEKWWGDKRVKVIRYEDLVQNIESTVADCLKFLDLPFSEDCLNYREKFKPADDAGAQPPNDARNNLAYRSWQVSQPLFDGRGRWDKEMSAGEKETFKKLAGELLIRYGYAKDMNW